METEHLVHPAKLGRQQGPPGDAHHYRREHHGEEKDGAERGAPARHLAQEKEGERQAQRELEADGGDGEHDGILERDPEGVVVEEALVVGEADPDRLAPRLHRREAHADDLDQRPEREAGEEQHGRRRHEPARDRIVTQARTAPGLRGLCRYGTR